MRGTTVREIKKFAKDQGMTLQEVWEEYDLYCFMGMWDNDDADVIVPDHFPTVASTSSSLNIKIY